MTTGAGGGGRPTAPALPNTRAANIARRGGAAGIAAYRRANAAPTGAAAARQAAANAATAAAARAVRNRARRRA